MKRIQKNRKKMKKSFFFNLGLIGKNPYIEFFRPDAAGSGGCILVGMFYNRHNTEFQVKQNTGSIFRGQF